MGVIYECNLRKSLLGCNLMNITIGSMNAPIKHLNRLSKMLWRFRYTVTVEKRFPKRKEKKTTLLMKSPELKRIRFNRRQHKHITK
jgi:hypothetical protein